MRVFRFHPTAVTGGRSSRHGRYRQVVPTTLQGPCRTKPVRARRRFPASFIAVQAFFLLLFATASFQPPAHAQPSYIYESFHSRFMVRADGKVTVRHHVVYLFQDAAGWVGLTVPGELGQVLDARVLDGGGRPLPEGTWDVERKEEGTVLWFLPEGSEERASVIYEYTVSGALKVEGDRTVLSWTGVPTGRASPVLESSASVELPVPVSPGELQMQVKTSGYRGQVRKSVVGDRQAVVELERLEAGAYYEFTASWPFRIMETAGPQASAQETPGRGEDAERVKGWEFEHYDVDIELHPDGNLTVRETQVVRFQGTFTYLALDLPARVPAAEEGRSYGRMRVRDIAVYEQGGDPLDPSSWRVEDVDGGKRVRIEFQTAGETRGWTIEYRVSGAVAYAAQCDVLRWEAVSRLREAWIRSSRVTLRLPQGTDPETVLSDVHFDRYAPPREHSSGKEGELLWWEASDVPPFTTFTVEAALPKGAVAVPWAFRPAAAAVGISTGAAILLLALAAVLLPWWKKSRTARKQRGHSALNGPPQGLTPAMAGMLMRQRPDAADIVATAVDLARRGYLVIQEKEERGVIRRRRFVFLPGDADRSRLLPHERAILTALIEAGKRASTGMSGRGAPVDVRSLMKAVREDSVSLGLFSRDPGRMRHSYMFAGWSLIGLASALYLLLPRWFDLGWLLVPALSPAPAGLAVWALGWFAPRRSAEGSRAYGEVTDYREYLADEERIAPETGPGEHFEANLPYAVALGTVEEWARKFVGLVEGPFAWFRSPDPPLDPVSLGRALLSLRDGLSP